MDFKDFFSKETLAKITNAAPLLGSILGPGGAAAGTVIKLVGAALGVESTPPAIETALQNNPDAILKLKELELNHKIEWEKVLIDEGRLRLEEERTRLQDVQNARQREIEITKITGKRDYSMEVLGWMIVVGFFITLATRMFIVIAPNQSENVGMLFGALITAFVTVVQYKYGSSKGSAEKTAFMAAQAQTQK